MSEFSDRFTARGQAIKEAYSAKETRTNRPSPDGRPNAMVDILVDLRHRARAANLDFDEIIARSATMAEYEWQMVGAELQSVIGRPVRAVA